MSYFKATMHQIRLRLRLGPISHWGNLQRSPRPLAGFKGPTSKQRGGKRGRGRGGKGRKERKEGKGRGRHAPNFNSRFGGVEAEAPGLLVQFSMSQGMPL